MNKKEKFFCGILAVMASMGIGAGSMYLANKDKIEFMNKYPLMLEVQEFIKDSVEIPLPENPSDETVINAYLSLYEDKYTVYSGKEDIFSAGFVQDEINNSPSAFGSGFQVEISDSFEMCISDVNINMSAYAQGIRSGDIVKSIDGIVVTDKDSAKKIIGKDGTTVNLTIERNGTEQEINFTRRNDSQASNGLDSKMYGNTLYVSIERENQMLFPDFKNLLAGYDFDSLILDLRNNGGGYAQTAVEMADLFINHADVILKAKNGEDMIHSTTDGVEYDVPIVLLVNEKTASAAEILTALLKQYADTQIVGTNTFGKGIYQNIALFHGGSLKYTEGSVIVGDWEDYHGKGIAPDFDIPMDSTLKGTEDDIQLDKALEILGYNSQK
ncbi:MAG: PDZ domain-containing protein [Ruminococcus sp.]|nr:PDZ domain-containing protein [Ruminococcus sp.]